MKEILIAAYSLGLGGIETSLITLIKELEKRYKITLVLEKKEGIFLEKISKDIKIVEYTPNNNKNIIIRKAINMIKQIRFKMKYKNKYQFSVAYATYSLSGGFVARTASKNSALWIHVDYLTLNNNDEETTKEYYKSLKYDEYKNIVFVSQEARNNFIRLFPEAKEKAIYCNNLIDGQNIIEKSKQEIEKEDLQKINKKEETIFLNIGRHDERQKRLTRLIKVAQKLKQEGLKFKIIFVGDGQDSDLYKKQVEEKQLEDKIIFLGKKQNPYPYYKISDCVILTSDYEGYPVVFLESMILKKPIITTKVSDYEQIENKFGLVTTKEIDDIYQKVKQFIENGYEKKQEFDVAKYNKEIIEKIERMIG
ncbi:MAG: glycosyltransferase [Clostridia bacterium]|nr:glycosyltransferase [Clostridia bacterium]